VARAHPHERTAFDMSRDPVLLYASTQQSLPRVAIDFYEQLSSLFLTDPPLLQLTTGHLEQVAIVSRAG